MENSITKNAERKADILAANVKKVLFFIKHSGMKFEDFFLTEPRIRPITIDWGLLRGRRRMYRKPRRLLRNGREFL